MSSPSHDSHGKDHGHGGPDNYHPHVVPIWLLALVFAALLLLTWLTVAVTKIQLGEFNILLAMGIATVKAVLVALYFMHLRWDKPFNTAILIGSIIFVGLFVAVALVDTAQYTPNVETYLDTKK